LQKKEYIIRLTVIFSGRCNTSRELRKSLWVWAAFTILWWMCL